ncbi:MazG-like family protein [Streptomyces sp. NPDC047014]|uniref:MazG-like family protein n=1 Tax=Streptomyces sp. NPDC047014 TaxID=3155736 RepID=UPI00340A812F
MDGELHGDDETWERIRRIKRWLDDSVGDLSPREVVLFRVLKVGEEFGEVAEAVHGVNGANPRKGRSHSMDDVMKELVDVAVTALVALETISPGEGRKEFEKRLEALVDRMPVRDSGLA